MNLRTVLRLRRKDRERVSTDPSKPSGEVLLRHPHGGQICPYGFAVSKAAHGTRCLQPFVNSRHRSSLHCALFAGAFSVIIRWQRHQSSLEEAPFGNLRGET